MRRAGRSLLWCALLGATVFLSLVMYLHSDDAAERLRRLAIQFGSHQLGEDLYVRRVHIDELFPLSVRLEEVSISAREDGLPLVDVAEVRISLAATPRPWEKIVEIEAVSVREPSLRLAMDGGQPHHFGKLIEAMKRPKPWKAQLGALDIESASTRVTVDPAGLGIAVAGLDLAFQQDADSNGAGTLGARFVELAVGEIREQAVLEPGNFTVDGGVVTLDGGALALDSARVVLEGVIGLPDPPGAPQARPMSYGLVARADIELPMLRDAWPRLPAMDGAIDVALGLSGEGLEPLVTFNLQGHDVAVHLTRPRPLVFKAEDPSLIGHFRDMHIVLEEESALRWGGGVIKPEGWFDLSGDMPFEVALELRDLRMEQVMDSATVPGSWVSMGMNGTATLSGTAARGLSATGHGRIAVNDMFVHDKAWDSDEPRHEMLHVPRAVVDADITMTGKHCLLYPATIRGPGTLLEVSSDFLFLKPLGLVIDVNSQRFDMKDLADRVAGVHVEGKGGVQARVEGPTRDLDITGSLELDDFVFTKWPFGRVGGDTHWHSRSDLEFTALRGRKGESDFEAEVRIQFADTKRGGQRERLEIAVDALVPEGHGRAEDMLPIFFGDSIDARGPAWGSASLFGEPGALSGSGQVSGRGIEYLWESFDSLDLVAEVRSGRLTIEEGIARKSNGDVLLGRGSIDRGGDVEFEFRLPRMELDQLDPVRRVFPAGRSSELVELAGGGGPWVAGVLSGDARIGGTLKNITLDGRLTLDDFVYRGAELGDTQLLVSIRDHNLVVGGRALDDRIVAKAEMKTDGLWDYAYGLSWRDFQLTPFLPRTILAQTEPVTAGMTGKLDGVGTLRDDFHDVNLSLREIWLERGRHRVEARRGRPVVVGYRGGAVRFDQIELASPEGGAGQTDLRVDGWWRLDGPLRVGVHGTVDVAFADLAYDVFDRAEATALVIDMEVEGMSGSSVDIDGRAELRGALLKTIYWPHPFEVDDARITLKDRKLEIVSLEGSMGGGRLEGLAGSYILLDRTGYRPREYELRVQCVACTVRYPSFMPPTSGTATLHFFGRAPDDLLLKGDVEVTEMVLRDPLNWQRSVLTFIRKFTETTAGADTPGLFDLELVFNSAEGAVGMRNNVGLLVGSAKDFRVVGDTNHVILEGTVNIEGGTIPYSGQDFELEPGLAHFRDRESWFPELEITMQTEVVNRDETYRIKYEISGPLNSPQLRASATPDLTESDINLLLLFGLTQDQLAKADLSDVLWAGGVGAGVGTFSETAATSFGQRVSGGASQLIPDRIEVVPVYTDTTGATTVWAVATKQLPAPLEMITLEGGVGYSPTGQNITWPTVARAQFRFQRHLYLEGSWLRDDAASRAYGNFGLDIKFEADLE